MLWYRGSFGCRASTRPVGTYSIRSLITSLKTDATCGNCNGTIDVTVTAGTTPYTYLWNDGILTKTEQDYVQEHIALLLRIIMVVQPLYQI
ncbi:MAG: SprB repeat-containing protein [Bacteroidetes bacterium]|nr:SprB repeat-containing protein [Bacteroidota bacterium]